MSIDSLIINTPYVEPLNYWKFDQERQEFFKQEGRRPAGYFIPSAKKPSFDDPGVFVTLDLVNAIRKRVQQWKDSGYEGATGVTKKLLSHWQDNPDRKFFFCQIEAIETIIWLTEAPETSRQGIKIPNDGSEFRRVCSKLATGTGKTVVMALVITWQILNKVAYPNDTRFSKSVLVIAPGITVRNRLAVLNPADPRNFYLSFQTVPPAMHEMLLHGKVVIMNWHTLAWETDEAIEKRRTVDKRGAISDEAYVKSVLGDLKNSQNIIVINDEAHHAWRVPAESKKKSVTKEEYEATIWISGLDRINKARGIKVCYDFSATPFAPSGKKTSEEALFEWIISDFGLNDAIESGLVKTPRVVVRDDGKLSKEYKSRFFHLYDDPEVKDDLNRKAEASDPLPDLVIAAYHHLGKDWLEAAKIWSQESSPVPPVMISVCNNTTTAKRIKHSFDKGTIRIPELCDPSQTLQVDSKALDQVDVQFDSLDLPEECFDIDFENMSKPDREDFLRRIVDTVGQIGQPGQNIKNVVSVQMLSEGWDCKTVTHIMGLRAFSSQLLCEQVVGRGLRRTSYDVDENGKFEPEYVNIFGVPFSFIPHETSGAPGPGGLKPKVRVEPLKERNQFEITWPNVIRIEHTLRPNLSIDLQKVEKLEIDAKNTPLVSQLAPIVGGQPNLDKITEIKIIELAHERRLQRIIFEVASEIVPSLKTENKWTTNDDILIGDLIPIVEKVINSDRINITPLTFHNDDLKRRLILTLNMQKIVQHIRHALRFQNSEKLELVFDRLQPEGSTADMAPWWTSRPFLKTVKSHINFVVLDSTWEGTEANELDNNSDVVSWTKNDHIGFHIDYLWNGVPRIYIPDFLIRLKNGLMLVLEVKGQETERDRVKRRFLQEWIGAVNTSGAYGAWDCAVSFKPGDVTDIIADKIRSRS